ncbi:PspC domain-containing protein [Shewanella gaetbuli]|uniref:PspC domain-containing protein n=1 Tax=Shewanella gaetbuli TaxID=220752 RepID=A0A9X2CL52_9GAMM|nr:PspC domain-containing protein [Shewanella gaetbuli]MCL1142339.1 PspC domain-containing protein [Shewanella gaetbuli]
MQHVLEKLAGKSSVICGVCQYLAKQFGWSLLWTRVIALLILVANPFITLIVYLVFAIIADTKAAKY